MIEMLFGILIFILGVAFGLALGIDRGERNAKNANRNKQRAR